MVDQGQLLLHFLPVVIPAPHCDARVQILFADHELLVPSFYLVVVSAFQLPLPGQAPLLL